MAATTSTTMAEELGAARRRTLALVAHLETRDLERQIAPIMSPLVWDLGHIAAYEDLWLVQRHAGLPLLRPDLAALYDAFETPRAVRGDLALLGHAEALAYMDAVRQRTDEAMERHGVDPVIHEMVLRHELQHTETMRQAMALADLLPPGEPALPALPASAGQWLDVPAGTHALGAREDVFAYDNERPVHTVEVPAFRIAARPVTTATFRHFCEGGGYVRREWWSDEGWAWKEEYDITHPATAGASSPPEDDAPACHVSFHEAEALARWRGARLPTEAEWEKASPRLSGVGHVWEWTSSPFQGYPGFSAFPYREYSEAFFGDRHRVLRGGSWATARRVATFTFRNWDLPERRQIFAGVRLAIDAEEHA
jgi:iron(II)-dependent oxidoreductase